MTAMLLLPAMRPASYFLDDPAPPVFHMNRKSCAVRQVDIQYIIVILRDDILYRKRVCVIQNIK